MATYAPVRPLCEGCCAAAASTYCTLSSSALCGPCAERTHGGGGGGGGHACYPLGPSPAVLALCGRCGRLPAGASSGICDGCSVRAPASRSRNVVGAAAGGRRGGTATDGDSGESDASDGASGASGGSGGSFDWGGGRSGGVHRLRDSLASMRMDEKGGR